MAVANDIRIVAAERLNGGLVIKFDDGCCAFYPASLLHAVLPKAKELEDTRTDW